MPNPVRNVRSKEYCFTLNNYDEPSRLHLATRAEEVCVYLCYQPELSPTTATPHLQGYLCLTTERTLKGVKDQVFDTAALQRVHLEISRGTKDQCRDYCRKDESRDPNVGFGFVEFGRFEDVPARRGQGARNDIHAAADIIRNGGTMYQVAQDHPDQFVRYHRGFTALQLTLWSRPRTRNEAGVFEPPRVFWYWGPTGTGKTRAVFEENPDADIYRKPSNNEWWDGYCGQPIVLLDDYRSNWFSFSYLLNITDIYPMQVAVKGGYSHYSPKKIYITCPKPPELLYESLEERQEGSVAQLTRRITDVKRFGPEPEPPLAMIFNR
jgi:hypothetical protein